MSEEKLKKAIKALKMVKEDVNYSNSLPHPMGNRITATTLTEVSEVLVENGVNI